MAENVPVRDTERGAPVRKASSGLHPKTFSDKKLTPGEGKVVDGFTETISTLVGWVDHHCPSSAEMTLAMRHLEYARYRFNQAVCFYGVLEEE